MADPEAPKVHRLNDATVAAALSDDYERRILAACIGGPKSVKQIEQETRLPIATVYRHVERLRELGVLVVERSAITPDGKRYELYRSRIQSARIEVDRGGVRVLWNVEEATEERLARAWKSLRGI